jgi:uncharacterized integral membrane protein
MTSIHAHMGITPQELLVGILIALLILIFIRRACKGHQ